MNSSLSLCPDSAIRGLCMQAGACAVGFAEAGAVDESHRDAFSRWIAGCGHAAMAYMERYAEQRFDTRLLLPGARSVISVAFPYRPSGGYHHALIADYALGRDYHVVLRRRLQPVIDFLSSIGARNRVCVDTAPVLERFWAVKTGVGFIGRNKMLIVPGVGTGIFLAEIITTQYLHPDTPCDLTCGACFRCVSACPGCALSVDGLFAASRCRSYLTIESREPLPSQLPASAKVYGCDICAAVCPYNKCEPPEPVSDFFPDRRLLSIDRETLMQLTSSQFKRLFAGSAVSRITAAKMRNNSGG